MKKKIKTTLNTLPKLHLACGEDELRPVMQHILVTKQEVIASDAHILVIHKTDNLFDEEFIEKMPDRFLIHKYVWQEMCKGHVSLKFENEMIKIQYKKYPVFFPIELELQASDETKNIFSTLNKGYFQGYPDYKAVLPSADQKQSINRIGINSKLLSKLEQAMFYPNELPLIRLEFYGKSRCIKVTPKEDEENETIALLMPSMLNEDFDNDNEDIIERNNTLTLLAEQHKNTRHDAIDKVCEISVKWQEKVPVDLQPMFDEIKRDIMNLKHRHPQNL